MFGGLLGQGEMADAERALEEVLRDVGNRLLAPPSAVDELLPILDQAETLLSRVEQSPSQSMTAALHPAMMGLTAKELLGHSDTGVKVAVASCISEITRITAPEAPYNDDLMKEIFQMIVQAFENLDDIHNHFYSKRVSILETVAKVRSCVVMLDLDCDTLILDMFHHFLKTIRESHPENVFSSMELIMTVVLEESEDISSDLLCCLLASLRKDNKDILPIARRLTEKVIGNSVLKLKPCLLEAVQSLGAPLDDYSEIVTSICQKNSDVAVHSGLNICGECLADDSKLSVRTVSDEVPKGSVKLESEVACGEENGNAAVKSSKFIMSNGTVKTENDDSLAQPNMKTEDSGHNDCPEHTATSGVADKMDTPVDHNTKEDVGHKSNSVIQSAEVTDHSQIDSDKETVECLNQSKGGSTEVDTPPSKGATDKETEATAVEAHVEKTELQTPADKSPNDGASAISTALSEKFPDKVRSKRGRSTGSKGSLRKHGINADASVSPTGVGKNLVNEHRENETVPSIDISSEKQDEGISESEPKTLRRSVKKGPLGNKDKGGKPSTDSNSKMEVEVMSDLEEKNYRTGCNPPNEGGMGKIRVAKTRHQMGRVSSENNAVCEPTLKEEVSAPKTDAKSGKDENRPVETPKIKSQKKRAREKEISETPRDERKYDESLVGAKIKVWWPDDEQFYPGVIDSYDPVSMKHKVLYVDGDEEVLLLKDEVFRFLKGDEEDEEKEGLTPMAASEMSRKRAKASSSSSSKKSRVVTSSKGGSSAGEDGGCKVESGRKHKVYTTKFGGRRGCSMKSRSKTYCRTPTGSKSQEQTDGRSSFGIPKSGATSKDELTDGSPKVTTKFKDIPQPGSNSREDAPNAGSTMKNASKTGKTSKAGVLNAGSKAKDDVVTSGIESRNDVVKSNSKSNEDGKSKAKKKQKSSSTIESGKSDVNDNSVKGNAGSSKGNKNDAALNTNSSTGISPGSGERSGKKRRK
uniref:Sister chromatid cohesion protein PDS5 B-B n=2 Tax=Anthurium amnicola TaxID=1678845 RepID=A0A1D1YV29_9ARAE